MARVAKPGETLVLVSENCSPIVNGTYTATRKGTKRKTAKNTQSETNMASIPLGDGRTVMLPLASGGNEDQQLELDESAKAKLLEVRSIMDKLLKENST